MSSVSSQILQHCNAYLSAGLITLPSQGAWTVPCSSCELVVVSSAGGAVVSFLCHFNLLMPFCHWLCVKIAACCWILNITGRFKDASLVLQELCQWFPLSYKNGTQFQLLLNEGVLLIFTAPLNAHTQFCCMHPSFVVCMKKHIGAVSWDIDVFESFSGCWAFGPGSSSERAVGQGRWSPQDLPCTSCFELERAWAFTSPLPAGHRRGRKV